MTKPSLEHLIALDIPHSAMWQAIITAHPRSGTFDRARLLVIAHHHGGGQELAEALNLRLGLVGLLYQIDPMVIRPNSISTEVLARILIALPLSVVDGKLQFDGDDFANRMRLASNAQGQA